MKLLYLVNLDVVDSFERLILVSHFTVFFTL